MSTTAAQLGYIVFSICFLSVPLPTVLCEWSSTGHLPNILIAIDARSNEQTLPFCLNDIFRLDYDRQRISLLIGTSVEVTAEWRDELSKRYHSVEWRTVSNSTDTSNYVSAKSEGSQLETETVSSLRFYQTALDAARRSWADYFLILRSGDFLAAQSLLKRLVSVNFASGKHWLVHPVLFHPVGHLEWDNTMSSLSAQFTELQLSSEQMRVGEWLDELESPTCLPTAELSTDWPADKSALLFTPIAIDMRDYASAALRFYPPAFTPSDKAYASDMLFTHALVQAACFSRPGRADSDCWSRALDRICLLAPRFDSPFGYFVFYADGDSAEARMERFVNFSVSVFVRYGHAMRSIGEHPAFGAISGEKSAKQPEVEQHGWKVLLINLQRRSRRRQRSEYALRMAGVGGRVQLVRAADRVRFTAEGLAQLGVRMLPEFVDLATQRRRLLYGEVGCFLSHYSIWQRVAFDPHLPFALVLEDDFVLESGFLRKLTHVLQVLHKRFANGSWDFVYLGREPFYSHFGGQLDRALPLDSASADDADVQFLSAGYSHYTISYLLSKRGAKKLVARSSLARMVPADQFLALVAKSHAVDSWFEFYNELVLDSDHGSRVCAMLQDFGGEPNCGLPQQVDRTLGTDALGDFHTLTVNPLLVHPLEYSYSQPSYLRSHDATDVEVHDHWLMPDPPFYSDAEE